MKEFLQYVKNLETDFDLSERSYRSKIELGVTSLITSDYIKAKEMFDGAIEMDSDMPAGWIGKCFAEIALVSDDDFNDLMLDEYINRALRKSDELMNYRAALCGCLIYRHDQLINKYYNLRAKANNAAANAANNANLGVGAAAIGLALSGNRRSVASNIVGGALITGGISTAIVENANMNYFKNAGNEYDYLLMYQCLMSSPIVKFSSVLSQKIENSKLVKFLLDANLEWNQTMNLVLADEVISLYNHLNKIKVSDLILLLRTNDAVLAKRMMILQSIIKEDNCEENIELQKIITLEEDSNIQNQVIKNLEDFEVQSKGKSIGFIIFLIGLIVLIFNQIFSVFIFIISLLYFVIYNIKNSSKPNEMELFKDMVKCYFKKYYKDVIEEQSQIYI
jgi:hypothetical protein